MNRSISAIYGSLVATVFTCGVLHAQEADAPVQQTPQQAAEEAAVTVEIRYVNELLQAGLSDYADMIIADGLKKYPNSGPRFKGAQTSVMLQQGKLQEVIKQIDAMKDPNGADAWTLRLTVANYYYAAGKYADSDKIYKEFFSKVKKPGPDLITLYREAAYQYVQLLLLSRRDKEAVEAFRFLLSVPMDDAMLRRAQTEAATLMVKLAEEAPEKERKAALDEAEKIVDKLFWKQDIWFGSAVVLKASIAMQRGKVEEAQSIVETYMSVLTDIHNSLIEQDPSGEKGYLRMSPMSSCRYLLGVMLQKEAEKMIDAGVPVTDKEQDEKIRTLLLGARGSDGKRNGNGAFNHFLNVFIKYPESQFAVEAGNRSEAIRKLIKIRYNTELRTQVTADQMKKVRQQQFAGARVTFSENKFEQAAAAYEKILASFPNVPEALPALSDLAICYIEMSDKDPMMQIYADTVVGHLAERFSANKELGRQAGDQLRLIAERYLQNAKPAKRDEVLGLFTRFYPDHPSAVAIALEAADKLRASGQTDKAIEEYNRVIAQYAGQPWAFMAYNRIVDVRRKEGNFTNLVSSLEAYLAALAKKDRPGLEGSSVRFQLAELRRKRAGELAKSEADEETKKQITTLNAMAIRDFNELAKVLKEPRNIYENSAEDRAKNEEMREASLFLSALCLAQLQVDDTRRKAIRTVAINNFEQVVKEFPKGALAPKALLQVGTIYTSLADMDKAQASLARLRKEYPESQEAKNSVPLLAAALIDMGLRGDGVAMYKKMLEPGGTYSDSQYLTAAKTMAEAREYELSLQALEKVFASGQKGAVQMEAQLEQARNLLALKRLDESHKKIEAFLKEYGKTTFALPANQLLIDVIAAEIENEMDDAKRNAFMGKATDVFRFLKQLKNKPEDMAGYDLQGGYLLKGKMQAEIKLGRKEEAEKTRGKAITAFQTLMMRLQPSTPALGETLEAAYHEAIPLMMELKIWPEIVSDGEKYLSMFPTGRYATDIRNWVNQAKIEVNSSKK